MNISLMAEELVSMKGGNFIPAIKGVSDRYGCGLKAAKDAVETVAYRIGWLRYERCRTCDGTGQVLTARGAADAGGREA